jgi:hypothetical protein
MRRQPLPIPRGKGVRVIFSVASLADALHDIARHNPINDSDPFLPTPFYPAFNEGAKASKEPEVY